MLAFMFVGLYLRDYGMTLLGAIGLMVWGVFVLIYTISGVSNWAVDAFGIIMIGIGAFVTIRGSLEMMKK
jgi:hypothetical protein